MSPALTRRRAAAFAATAAVAAAAPPLLGQNGSDESDSEESGSGGNPLDAAKGLLKEGAAAVDPSGLSELVNLTTSGDVTLRDLRRFGRPQVSGVVATVEGSPQAVGTFVGKLYELPKLRPTVALRPLGFPKLNAVLATVSVGDVPGD